MEHVIVRGLLLSLLALSFAGCDREPKSPQKPNTTAPRWVHQHTPHADIALVFVHGIFGDTIDTWRTKQTSFFDLLEADEAIGPKVDMYAFGYTSNMIKPGSFGIDEAAATLHARLETAGVLEYPAVVFINHSMGGLVVMQLLTDHPEMLSQVPAVVLFGSPQSGADVTRIARHISGNEALDNMLPGDSNAFIRVLDSRWKKIDAAERPRVYCAYEKQSTFGIKIVEWASGTRHCDDTLPINANHITIVKPDDASHDSMMVVQRALKPLLSKPFQPKLETPDFALDDGKAVLTIDNPFGKRDVTIKNAGGGVLRYSLEQWPDGLHIWPGAGDRSVPAEQADKLQVALAYGQKKEEFAFVLKSNASEPQQVLVRIPNLETVRANREALATDVLTSLNSLLEDADQVRALEAVSREQAQEIIVGAVHDAIAKRDLKLHEAGQWVLTAELLTAVNWPSYGAVALQRAQGVAPAIVNTPSIKSLSATTAVLSGESDSPTGPALPPERLRELTIKERTPFTSDQALEKASDVSDRMMRIPNLRSEGLSLQGDVASAKGEDEAAVRSYREAVESTPSPSGRLRLDRAMQRTREP